MDNYRAMLANLVDLWCLHDLLVSGTTGRQAMNTLHMSRSTLFRALRLLRSLGAPIQYDRTTGTFSYRRSWDFWSALRAKVLFTEPQRRR